MFYKGKNTAQWGGCHPLLDCVFVYLVPSGVLMADAAAFCHKFVSIDLDEGTSIYGGY
jgi:hypothetical protein